MDAERLGECLASVPEVSLGIFRLTWELVNEKGRLDQKKVLERMPEVEAAIGEARQYVGQVQELAGALQACLQEDMDGE